MRLHPTSLSLALLPLVLPLSAEEPQAAPPATAAADCGQRADETLGTSSRVDAALRELGTEFAPATTTADAPMPEAPEGQCVIVSEGGLFFDAANSQLVYVHNVRLSDARARLRAANRLYVQLPKEEADAAAEQKEGSATTAPATADAPPPPTPAPKEAPQETAPASPQQSTDAKPDPFAIPVEVNAYDVLVNSVDNRILFTSGPGVNELTFRQGESFIVLTQGENQPARALADELGNVLLEAPVIHVKWKAEDGTFSEFRTTGGRALYHAASHALVMDGPVEASYRNGESTMQCSGPFCVTFTPEEGATPARDTGFMSQFTSMRFSGIAAATATGNVQLRSLMDGEGTAISGDALYYNGTTGEIKVPGTPCILSYGRNGSNTLQTNGILVLEEDGDIHLTGKGNIEGTYERPGRNKGDAPLRGTLTAKAPLSFHAANGTITTRALNARDPESSFSCTGDVLLTLTPRTAEELAELKLPAREKLGMVNLAIARFGDINTVKAQGQVRGQMLDPAKPSSPEATLTSSQLDANLTTGEVLLTGVHETASVSFRGYSLSGTADTLNPATVHLKTNGDIEVRGVQVACTVPADKGMTTLTSTDRLLLAREPRSLSMGPGTRIQSPDGIVTTNGPLQAVLAASNKSDIKPISPRYPHLVYDFSGLDSAETFEGATVRTSEGSLQCSQHLSILMLPEGSSARSSMGGIRSAIATGRVLLAAKDSSGRVMRAAGDRLEVNGITGEKRLTGSRVVLEDARNRHEASGEGAAIRIDARNNARITGARHSTSATGIRAQVEEGSPKSQQNKPKSN